MIGEQSMWIEVIKNSFVDAFKVVDEKYNLKNLDKKTYSDKYRIKKSAINFLTFDRPNFRRVCAFAGLNPKWVMRKYKELKKGNLEPSEVKRLIELTRINSMYSRKSVTKVFREDELRKLINGNVYKVKSSRKRAPKMVIKA